MGRKRSRNKSTSLLCLLNSMHSPECALPKEQKTKGRWWPKDFFKADFKEVNDSVKSA